MFIWSVKMDDNELFDQDLADEGVASGVEREDIEPLNQPFDPSSVSIETKVISLISVLRRIQNKTINLSPPFQRNSVWDRKRQSLLIESMMLRIPLPMFYVAEDRNGNWEVVDGLQRLTAIHEFVKGPDGDGKGYKLKELEFWGKNYNDKTFFALEKMPEASMTVNHILETELQFTIIKPDTSEKVKRNIFKRINTGGMRLSEQEIRHALNQGLATDFLLRLSKEPCYLDSIGLTINDSRMAGRELILRHLAFNMMPLQLYRGDMDDFLSNTMRCINDGYIKIDELGPDNTHSNIERPDINLLASNFKIGLIRNNILFGEHAFRKSFGKDRKSPINKSLFDVWMFYLSTIDEKQFDKILMNRKIVLDEYITLLNNNDFGNAISRHSASIGGVQTRYKEIGNLIGKYL
jgi:hypothetical protein